MHFKNRPQSQVPQVFSALSQSKKCFLAPRRAQVSLLFPLIRWVPVALSDFQSGLFHGWAACLQVNRLEARETSLNSELLRKKIGWEIKDRVLKNYPSGIF